MNWNTSSTFTAALGAACGDCGIGQWRQGAALAHRDPTISEVQIQYHPTAKRQAPKGAGAYQVFGRSR